MNSFTHPYIHSSAQPLDWKSLVAAEPQLRTLRVMVRSFGGQPGTCPSDEWSREVKPRLNRLVGPDRSEVHPLLSTPRAYDAAYAHLRGELPLCRNCPWCRANEDAG